MKKSKLNIGVFAVYGRRKVKMLSSQKSNIYKKKSSAGASLLMKGIRALGYKSTYYLSSECQLFFDGKDSRVLHLGNEMKKCDLIISRVGPASDIDLELSILKQFHLMGIPVINKYLPVARAKSKLRSMQILTKAKIRVPNTVVVRKFEYLDRAIKQVGGYPIVVKSVFGNQGSSVAIIESRRSLYSALDILWRSGDSNILLIQEYVAEAENSDYRAFVVGDKVVSSMKRTAKSGEFRSNVHLGGDVEAVDLTMEEKRMAIKSTKLMGLDYSGVDIMRGADGPIVVEINANPGFAGINEVSDADVTELVVKYALKKYNL